MQGALADTSPTELWLRLSGQAVTGSLQLTSPHGDATMRFVHGDLAGAVTPMSAAGRGLRLGERLVHAGRLERHDLDGTLREQSDADPPVALGQLLVKRGLVAEDVVRLFLQEQLLDAVAEVIGWTRGRYAFEVGHAAWPQVQLAVPVPRALTEVRRRAEERDLVRTRVPGPTAVPTPTPDGDRPPRLSADAFTVLSAVDGMRSVGAIAASLGYADDEASRVIYRLALQGLVTIADTSGSGDDRTIEDTTLSTPTRSDAPPLADQGWADQRASASVDEPEPWVGWARAADPPTDDGTSGDPGAEAAGTGDDAVPATGHSPAAGPPPGHRVDDDTRQALFSELHAVSREDQPTATRAEQDPRRNGSSPPPAAAEDPPPPADVPADDHATDERPTDDPSPAQGPSARTSPSGELSSDDVSDLLRELHALNLDEDD